MRLIRSALAELGHDAPAAKVEAISFIVFGAMTGRAREYHGIGHVFAVASGLPPIGRLAAVYHDTVYQQVDHGFLPAVWEKIRDAGTVDDERRVTLSHKLREDFADVAAIFGFAPGQAIEIRRGLNEFLSALLAVRELGGVISRKQAWTLAACIEATIPFRGKDADGRFSADLTRERLIKLASDRGETLPRDELDEMLRLSVRVANSDVQSFAQSDLGAFLDDTWKLLPESYPELNNSAAAYSLRSYCNALVKTEAFLSSLDPTRIFQQYGGAPAQGAFSVLKSRSQSNLTKGCEYIRAKIVTVSILEALADLTGGDAPVSYFTGSAESGEVMAYALMPEDEALPDEGLPAIDALVLHVLRHGRNISAHFDTTKSPLSAHLYERLGTDGVQKHAARAKQARSGQRGWKWYLEGFPRGLISEMVQAVAEIAVERRERLLALTLELEPRASSAKTAAHQGGRSKKAA